MGCFTTYNHPSWSRVDAEEICGLEDIWAIEVFNYGTEVECGEGYNTVFWDRMLAAGKELIVLLPMITIIPIVSLTASEVM